MWIGSKVKTADWMIMGWMILKLVIDAAGVMYLIGRLK
jgi:hypothetical protein